MLVNHLACKSCTVFGIRFVVVTCVESEMGLTLKSCSINFVVLNSLYFLGGGDKF